MKCNKYSTVSVIIIQLQFHIIIRMFLSNFNALTLLVKHLLWHLACKNHSPAISKGYIEHFLYMA